MSSFAIHHLEHQRKLALYKEIFSILNPGGIFCNLDHVSSPSSQLHKRFMAMLGKTPETEDISNRILDLNIQPEWLKTRFYRCGLLLEMVRICFINRGKTITMTISTITLSSIKLFDIDAKEKEQFSDFSIDR